MEITMLGTSSMVPTKLRNTQSIFLDYEGEGILFDCGEGTQRQMNISNINRLRVKKIFISHWHGDHVSGLIGLIQTIGNVESATVLDVYGPIGTKEYFNNMLRSCSFELRIKIKIHEASDNFKAKHILCDTNKYYVEAYYLEHSVPCLGFRFVEKNKLKIDMNKIKAIGLKEGPILGEIQRGKNITHNGKTIYPKNVTYTIKGRILGIINDTKLCKNCYKIAENVDCLISECTYSSVYKDKANQYAHMTVEDVAKVVNNSNVKKVILTHFSQRFKDDKEIQSEADKYMNNAICGYDFMKIKIEHGS